MNEIERIQPMSARDFALFGMQDMAYIKSVTVNDVVGYAVHAADGTQIACALRGRKTRLGYATCVAVRSVSST
jgi:hypothetical protein